MRLIELSDRIDWAIHWDSPPHPKWFVQASRSNCLAIILVSSSSSDDTGIVHSSAKIVTKWACGLSFPSLTGRLAECFRWPRTVKSYQ